MNIFNQVVLGTIAIDIITVIIVMKVFDKINE